ncbi:phage/plasmid replication protein, II/X family [Rhodoferax sp.]|uniref:phage/plasmid replication protein, II/X family n=1 Tax=Rhodoferax sp. TaxID=50421 RepID=UPI0027647387|nr:phage/plasmid replication protein, II/X family [Rhodoferax sp.]
MKKSNAPTVASKKPQRPPMGLNKLDLGTTRKNVAVSGAAAATNAAKPHRNTITSTDKRTDPDNSVGHVSGAGDDNDFDNIELGLDQQPAGVGGGRNTRSTESTVGTHAHDGSSDPEQRNVVPAWDVVRIADADRKHVANCVCIDTIGLEFKDIPPDAAKLAKSFSERDDDGAAVSGTGWGKSAMRAPTGKRSFVVNYDAKTEKLSLEGSNAVHRQGHNVVASGDMTMTAFSMVRAMNFQQSLGWPPSVGYQLAHGVDVEVTRIDAFLLLRVPEGVSKAQFINALAIAGIKAGLNTSLYVNESVYFNQNSQLEAGKFYDKEAELRRARKGGLPDVPGIEDLMELNKHTVRLECVFRAKRLVQIAKTFGGRPHPCLFTTELLAEMVLTLLRKFTVHGDVFRRLESAELNAIPLPYRSTVAHWQNGEVLLDMVKSERVLNEQKAFLKAKFNLNLNAPPPGPFHEPMSLADILVPGNIIPVPEVIRDNPQLFYQIDMEATRRKLRKQVGNGIGSVILDPYRPKEIIIIVDGEPRVV